MYTELMMREHGFDDDPRFRLILHTDAIWRACRIILDVRMHRGEVSWRRRRGSSSSTPTSRSRMRGPRSSGTRSARPTRCRTCSGGPCCSACGTMSSDAWATASACASSTTRSCATAPSRSASTDGCWRRRLIGVQVIPAIDLERGRSRVVYWPGAAAGIGAPTDRPERSPSGSWRWARRSSTWSTSRAPGPASPATSTRSAPSPRRWRSRCRWPGAWTGRTRSVSRSRPARPGSCWRWGRRPPDDLRAWPLRVTGSRSVSIHARTGSRRFPGAGRATANARGARR